MAYNGQGGERMQLELVEITKEEDMNVIVVRRTSSRVSRTFMKQS